MNQQPKYIAKLGNVYFVSTLGISLRRATAGMRDDQLPRDVRRALRHLDRLEFLRMFIEPKRAAQLSVGQ
jgi:hypothetical protein